MRMIYQPCEEWYPIELKLFPAFNEEVIKRDLRIKYGAIASIIAT